MKIYFQILFLSSLIINCSSTDSGIGDPVETKPPVENNYSNVDYYLTKADQSELFQLHENSLLKYSSNINFSIQVNSNITYQEMDGFGFALTGGSALHINNMGTSQRAELLNELFDTKRAGISYLRISVGASDLDIEPFSYDDLPIGQTEDLNLNHFSIAKDQEHLIPILKEILAINPNIKILSSPWSAPSWMKTSNSTIGGSLMPEYYSVYANYFVKYIKAYEAEGIPIDAITVQNEPHHDSNNPSMRMEANEMANFVKNHLGPVFVAENIQTKIIVWDHNADNVDYPISIFNDADANKYIDGSAFHLYGGTIDNLNTVHNAHPNKNLYFTEQWVGVNSDFDDNLKWHTRELIIGATRNWCKNVLEWNLVSNSQLKPHTPGGCTQCLGGLTIDGNTEKKNVGYYIIAHASKFVRPGSKRIASNYSTDLPNVAFKTPTGQIVVIVLNNTSVDISFNILGTDEQITASLSSGAVATYVWD
ncbi:glycoside hydrolase family 30 protein [Seonamhaeicola maritimus]|uniref:glycoside hydrolase family 30 protein n=1 Tax=Seonamhaeicola maritimus TaxID=2591822 RepID=UPI002493E81D|nr:glycoside hydrolase family 30 beta sandwich domain-containing protein [Seonamhaeicola maritimus]